MTTIININEITVFRLLGLGLLGRAPYVLAVNPFFPPLAAPLEKLTKWFIGTGRARWIIDYIPGQKALWEYPTRTFLYDVFGLTEDWHNRYFGLDHADARTPAYGYAFKLITCNHMKAMHFHVLLLGAAQEKSDGTDLRVYGLMPELAGLFEAYWNRPLPQNWTPVRLPNKILNFFVMVPLLVYSILWTLVRTRVRVRREKFFFAADYLGDRRDFRTYAEVADGGPVLLVRRNDTVTVDGHAELESFSQCGQADGRLDVAGMFSVLKFLVADNLKLFLAFGDCGTNLYYKVATLPYRRAMLRAFFTRFRPSYFWGRDDYNVEHILRRQELNKVGGISLGIGHGYPAYSIKFPMWRYISFDRYYVFGRAIYDAAMNKTWKKDMVVVPVGTFGAARDDYARIGEPKPNNILIFSAVFIWDPAMVAFVRGLARAFPARKILLQVKKNFVDLEAGRKYVNACTEGLENVIPTRAPLIELTRQARYAFSDPSTVVVESLQFGMISFFIDIMAQQKTSIFRRYPALCVSSAEDAAARIAAIENGEATYPRKEFGNLVDLSGRVLFDVIREDIGLAPQEQSAPLVRPTAASR